MKIKAWDSGKGNTVTATTNGRWSKTTLDALGRTISVVKPDGSSTTSYLYQGNTVKVTDPAGKWKLFTMDANGNLTHVTEPNPSGGANYETSYTYDGLNHLTGVSMPRDGYTQTRTFTYSGDLLTSATNPENGTVNYTYTNGKIASKVDAKNQRVEYGYDSLQRLTQIRRYPVNGQAQDTCQQTNFYYDTNPFDSNYSQYIAGRLAAVQYYGQDCTTRHRHGHRLHRDVQLQRRRGAGEETAAHHARRLLQ